jgi:hypothetical protein
VAERHPDKEIIGALRYARQHGWTALKSTGRSAHAWGVMRCPADCPQVSIYSTPRVATNHERIRSKVDSCAHEESGNNG